MTNDKWTNLIYRLDSFFHGRYHGKWKDFILQPEYINRSKKKSDPEVFYFFNTFGCS